MSCNQKNPGAPAAGPVGHPLEGGDPNIWNLGGGNFYSHNVNVLDTPHQSGGRKRKNVKRTRKNKKSKRRNIKHKKRTNKRKKMHKKKLTNANIRRINAVVILEDANIRSVRAVIA